MLARSVKAHSKDEGFTARRTGMKVQNALKGCILRRHDLNVGFLEEVLVYVM